MNVQTNLLFDPAREPAFIFLSFRHGFRGRVVIFRLYLLGVLVEARGIVARLLRRAEQMPFSPDCPKAQTHSLGFFFFSL